MKRSTVPAYVRDMLKRLSRVPREEEERLVVEECNRLAEYLLREARRLKGKSNLLGDQVRSVYTSRMAAAWIDYRQGDKFGALAKAGFAVSIEQVARNSSMCYAVGTTLKGWAENEMEYVE